MLFFFNQISVYVPRRRAPLFSPYLLLWYYFEHISQTYQSRGSQMVNGAKNYLGCFKKCGFLGPIPKLSELVSLRWDLEMFIFIIRPSPLSDTDALWETHPWKHINSFEARELSYHFVYVPKGQAWPTVHMSSVSTCEPHSPIYRQGLNQIIYQSSPQLWDFLIFLIEILWLDDLGRFLRLSKLKKVVVCFQIRFWKLKWYWL